MTYTFMVYVGPSMTRTQILLPPPLLKWLRSQSKKRGLSVSEVVRGHLNSAKMEQEAAK